MPQQQKFAFQRDFVQLATEKKGWPPHSLQAKLLRPWRSTGIKRATYTRIRSGGSATRKDLYDLLRLHTERAYEPFSTVVETYLTSVKLASKDLPLASLFEATTVAVDSVDYMATGGAALFELIPRLWANPCNHVTGLSTSADVANLAGWLQTVHGRQLADDERMEFGQAAKFFQDVCGMGHSDFDRQLLEWRAAFPWTTVFSGYVDSDDREVFVRTGGNVVAPLSEPAYGEIASGRRRFDDIHARDLQAPAFGVYLYASCECPIAWFEDATRNSVIALMWQIAALTADGCVRALAPAPSSTSETRLRKSGFQQIGVCKLASREVPLWEMHANSIQQFILNSMRCVLRSEGFLERPPIQ